MKTGAFLCVAFVGAATVLAQKTIEISFKDSIETPVPANEISFQNLIKTRAPAQTPAQAPAPAPAPAPSRASRKINYDEVKPFQQPTPITISEKAAVKFKPHIHIVDGCHPYPAVDKAGNISKGLDDTGTPEDGCGRSTLGSQVYGRAAWYENTWAMVYLWFFPKESSHRYGWQNVVVWINNPAVINPTILAVTPSDYYGYSKNAPPKVNTLNGTHPKIMYKRNDMGNSALQSIVEEGETQDLIMWDQLGNAARSALNTATWGEQEVAINDDHFNTSLQNSWTAWHTEVE